MLLFLAVITASSQEGQSEPGKKPITSPIRIKNETGFTLTVTEVFVCKAGEDWGGNLLDVKEKILLTNEWHDISIGSFDRNSNYDIRVKDKGGNLYTKKNFKFEAKGRLIVPIKINDFAW